MVKDIFIMKMGALTLDRSVLYCGKGYGIKEKVPVFSILLDTADGYVLIDTGMHPEGVDSPEDTWGNRAKELIPTVSKEDDIRNRLFELELTTDDIKYVINTHMHWDHTGGNQFFKHSDIFVQKSEYRYALNPDSYFCASYMKNHYDYDLSYRLVSGDQEIVPGVMLIYTPGHTQGHQSVLITMENQKKLIIAGDAVYTWDNIESMIPPGNCFDLQESVMSIQKLKTIQKLTEAELLPSHETDPLFYQKARSIIDRVKNY